MKFRHFPGYRQAGSAMIVALIFLLLMTLIGTAAMRGSTMQERMAGNTRDWNLAFQSAEAALREAEEFLLTTPVLPDFDDAAGLYQMNSPLRPVWAGGAPSDGNGFITYAGALPAALQPRYYMEELTAVMAAGTETETGTPLEEVFFFRITALGFGVAVGADGVTPVASVVLSSVYRSR
jgi:type IV pilus assembly protein PilX